MPLLPDDYTDRRRELAARWGAAVAAARKACGLSQGDLAADLGVSVWTLRAWEQGTRVAPLAIRRRVVADWGGDPERLDTAEDACPCCGRPYP